MYEDIFKREPIHKTRQKIIEKLECQEFCVTTDEAYNCRSSALNEQQRNPIVKQSIKRCENLEKREVKKAYKQNIQNEIWAEMDRKTKDELKRAKKALKQA